MRRRSDTTEEEDGDDVLSSVAGLFPPAPPEIREFRFCGSSGRAHFLRVRALGAEHCQQVVGQVVWRGATGLCEWLAAAGSAGVCAPPPVIAGLRVVELGAGCGLVGLMCRLVLDASRVLLTDYDPAVVALLAENVALNDGASDGVDVARVDWQQAPLPPHLAGAFDVALGSDVVYSRELTGPLFDCAAGLLRPGGVFAMLNGRARFSRNEDVVERTHRPHFVRTLQRPLHHAGEELVLSVFRRAAEEEEE